jgi:uncharacterized protein (DUF433 family)
MATTRTEPATQSEAPDLTIALDPHRPGRHRARLVHYGRPIWALIAYLQGNGWNIAETARDYDLPEEAVRAAIAYYEADPQYIDAYLLLLDDSFTT